MPKTSTADLLAAIESTLSGYDADPDVGILARCMPGSLHDTPGSESAWREMSKLLRDGMTRSNGKARTVYEIWFDLITHQPHNMSEAESQQALDEGRQGRYHGPHHELELDPDAPDIYREELSCGMSVRPTSSDFWGANPEAAIEQQIDTMNSAYKRVHRNELVRWATAVACVEAGMIPNEHSLRKHPKLLCITEAAREIAACDQRTREQ